MPYLNQGILAKILVRHRIPFEQKQQEQHFPIVATQKRIRKEQTNGLARIIRAVQLASRTSQEP
jgi:hypothetical protein